MFCYNCGKQLLEGAKFCPYCGAKMTNIEPQNPPNKVEKRELSIEKSKNLINYFLKKQKSIMNMIKQQQCWISLVKEELKY